MKRAVLLFEDSHWADLSPLTDLLPVPALAFGGSDLGSRWLCRLGERSPWAIEARAVALAAWRDAPKRSESASGDVLAINAAALPGPWVDAVLEPGAPCAFVAGGRLAAARLPLPLAREARGSAEAFEAFLRDQELPKVEVEARVVRWPWDLVEWNLDALTEDLSGLEPIREGAVHRLACLEEPSRIAIGAGARVDAFAVLDARSGPIRLGPGAVVQSHTLVQGPCSVGARTELISGAIGRSTFGPECRLAGEVDASVWQGWANKRHHGFVGHSAIGEWVNLGALTTTSDLKNNYGPVRAWAAGREVDTGLHKVGATIGAHVKTGIGTLLPTGAVVGTGSNLFGGGRFAPKHVPPFTWWDGETAVEHRIEALLSTARIAASRRQREFSAEDEAALRALHAASRPERLAGAGRRS